ncbi:MAG: hypothetical protein KJ749_07950, partial [Planctomycetes bacterium]|nr:hypothetical protein [Planctomycetota bacterium]
LGALVYRFRHDLSRGLQPARTTVYAVVRNSTRRIDETQCHPARLPRHLSRGLGFHERAAVV